MAAKSILIIGAGFAGLAAGCYARMNGYDATILERHGKPGGVVASWKRGDYLFDGGVHFWMCRNPKHRSYGLYEELGMNRDVSFMPLRHYMTLVDGRTGARTDVTSELDRFAAELASVSPADKDLIEQLTGPARKLAGRDWMGPVFDRPAELMGLWDGLQFVLTNLPMLRYLRRPYDSAMETFASRSNNDWVRFVLSSLFLPEVPVWFTLMLLAEVASGGISLVDGPSTDCVKAVERRFLELGGSIQYSAPVAEILVEGDRAIGVRCEDGSERRADHVISAADGRSTIYEMLKGRFVNGEIDRLYATPKLVRPALMVNWGVSAALRDKPWLTVYRLDEPIRVCDRTVEAVTVRIFNYTSAVAPEGKTVVQASVDTDWEPWRALREDREAYRAEKARAEEAVRACVESIVPELKDGVECTDVATPVTTWRYTGNFQGAYMAWLPTPDAITRKPVRTLPGLKNFSMAGQWSMPSGGIPTVLYSGRQAIQLLCAADRKRFVALRT